MDRIIYTFKFNEIIVDKDCCVIKKYKRELPHKNYIVETFCNEWNESSKEFMLELMRDEVSKKIASCIAKPRHGNAKADYDAKIVISTSSGVKFAKDEVDDIVNYLDAQMVDGWGECFFPEIREVDGTRFFID